jgi:hypothetical protein
LTLYEGTASRMLSLYEGTASRMLSLYEGTASRMLSLYEGPASINTNRYYNIQTTIISIYIYLFVHLYVIVFHKMFEWQTSDWTWMYTMNIWFISL